MDLIENELINIRKDLREVCMGWMRKIKQARMPLAHYAVYCKDPTIGKKGYGVVPLKLPAGYSSDESNPFDRLKSGPGGNYLVGVFELVPSKMAHFFGRFKNTKEDDKHYFDRLLADKECNISVPIILCVLYQDNKKKQAFVTEIIDNNGSFEFGEEQLIPEYAAKVVPFHVI